MMRKVNIKDLHEAVAAVCPIDGVDSNGGIQFREEATEKQRKDARQVVDRWDWNAEVEAEKTAQEEIAELKTRLTALENRP